MKLKINKCELMTYFIWIDLKFEATDWNGLERTVE